MSTSLPPETPPDNAGETDTGVRLQKLIAHRGLASRRNAELMIQGGLVRVNGDVVTTPGTKVDPEKDTVSVEGRTLPHEPEPFLFLFYKPRGIVSTLHDPDGKPTLREFFPAISPLIHVGRLDFQSEGVLLLTNNGDLAQRILHPRFAIRRTYLAKIQGVVTENHLERFRTGKVRLEGRAVEPVELELERVTQTNTWYRITLTEGRNREVRRLFEALGYFVLKLTRIAFGSLDLSGLEPGEYRLVTSAEIDTLLSGRPSEPRKRPSSSRERTGQTTTRTPRSDSGESREYPRRNRVPPIPARDSVPSRDRERRPNSDSAPRFRERAPGARTTPRRPSAEEKAFHRDRDPVPSRDRERRPNSDSAPRFRERAPGARSAPRRASPEEKAFHQDRDSVPSRDRERRPNSDSAPRFRERASGPRSAPRRASAEEKAFHRDRDSVPSRDRERRPDSGSAPRFRERAPGARSGLRRDNASPEEKPFRRDHDSVPSRDKEKRSDPTGQRRSRSFSQQTERPPRSNEKSRTGSVGRKPSGSNRPKGPSRKKPTE